MAKRSPGGSCRRRHPPVNRPGIHDSALVGMGAVDDVRTFYDDLAPLYHLVYENWEASVVRQGAALASIIAERWGADARVVLDGAVGIGTQALGLLMRGFDVIGSDLSLGAIRRATREAAARGLRLRCLVADFRALATRSTAADIVLIADNALPHLQSEADILTTLRECFRCARPGGGCLISMRDYGPSPPEGRVEVKPYGGRRWSGRRYDRASHDPDHALSRDRAGASGRAHERSRVRECRAHRRPVLSARSRRHPAAGVRLTP